MVSSRMHKKLEIMDRINAKLGFDPYDPNIHLDDYTPQVLHLANSTYDDLRLSVDELKGMYLTNGRIVKKSVVIGFELLTLSLKLNISKIIAFTNQESTINDRDLETRILELDRKLHYLKGNFIDNADCVEALDQRIKHLILECEYIDKILRMYQHDDLIVDRPRTLSKEVG